MLVLVREQKKGIWENIIVSSKVIDNLGIEFSNSFHRKVGNGESIDFWLDRWIGPTTCLKEKFPRLFAFEMNKSCSVRDR